MWLHSLLSQTDPQQPVNLSIPGMLVMGLSLLIVTGLAVFCIVKILGEKNPGTHHHAPLDIDTHDVDD